MTKQVYPVIFTQTEAEVLIEVPDLEILTQGPNLTEAIDVARDAIGITILSREEHDENIPQPSSIETVNSATGTFSTEGTSFVSMVDIDLLEYKRKYDTKIHFEISPDPFYSESNMAYLHRGIEALNVGRGMEHDIIEAEDE